MAQNNYIEDFIRRNGRSLGYEVKRQKKEARQPGRRRILTKRLHGLKAKLFAKKCREEKLEKARTTRIRANTEHQRTAPIPHFLLDRDIPEKKNEATGAARESSKRHLTKYAVPLPRVKGVAEVEAFKSITTGKKLSKHWKRMVTKPCFVGDDFTRKPPKLERFIRPMAMRIKSAHVTNPSTKETFNLPILGLKKNPHSELYTSLGILSKGTVLEVNVSALGMVSPAGKVIWGKYAQVTNHPENDGCVNAILLL